VLLPRYYNPPHEELLVAAHEQVKITELRLRKLWVERGGRLSPPASPAAGRAEQRAGLLHAHLGAQAWQTKLCLRVPTTLCMQQGGQVLNCIPGHAAQWDRRAAPASQCSPPACAAPGEAPAAKSARTEPPPAAARSPITTHVLDIARGVPAKGVHVELHRLCSPRNFLDRGGVWERLAAGSTDGDGRCSDLLPPGSQLGRDHYRRAAPALAAAARSRSIRAQPVPGGAHLAIK